MQMYVLLPSPKVEACSYYYGINNINPLAELICENNNLLPQRGKMLVETIQ